MHFGGLGEGRAKGRSTDLEHRSCRWRGFGGMNVRPRASRLSLARQRTGPSFLVAIGRCWRAFRVDSLFPISPAALHCLLLRTTEPLLLTLAPPSLLRHAHAALTTTTSSSPTSSKPFRRMRPFSRAWPSGSRAGTTRASSGRCPTSAANRTTRTSSCGRCVRLDPAFFLGASFLATATLPLVLGVCFQTDGLRSAPLYASSCCGRGEVSAGTCIFGGGGPPWCSSSTLSFLAD